MAYDDRKINPTITLADGYSIGDMSESYGTFSVFFGEREIGRVCWHGAYYANFRPQGKKWAYSITDYIKREDAQQHGANLIVSLHKTLGESFQLHDAARLRPNTLMTGFILYLSEKELGKPNSWNDMAIGSIHRNVADGTWKLTQAFGANEYTLHTIQETVDYSIKLAKEHVGQVSK